MRKFFALALAAVMLCFSFQVLAVPKTDEATTTQRVQPCTGDEQPPICVSRQTDVTGERTRKKKRSFEQTQKTPIIVSGDVAQTAYG